MHSEVIYKNGDHKWVFMGRDPEKPNSIIDSNQYLVTSNGKGMLLDAGGIEIYPQVLVEVSKQILPENIENFFISHQDPDIASSIALWVNLVPDMKLYIPWIWASFVAHFGMGKEFKFTNIPDQGMGIKVGKKDMYFVPAHFCHSSGFFTAFDPNAKILWSGDIGAALLPSLESSIFVEDFESHIKYMEGFHKRWMPSSLHLKKWVRRARLLKPEMICPQHGSIFRGDDVNKFLDWLDNLEVGHYDDGGEAEDINNAPWMQWNK